MGKHKPPAPPNPAVSTGAVRLHVTPLTPSTASSLLPTDVDKTNISYHTLPTFPEKSYGYVTVSSATADKLKRKLNGSTFRGVKVRVEEARPETWKEASSRDNEEEKPQKKRRKEKKQDGVLDGFELPGKRKVARGWGKEKECLFKAGVPPNKVEETKGDKEKKEKKERRRKKEKLVKEFDHQTKFPAFLKMAGVDHDRKAQDMVKEFVDGVGWVDGNGAVVEQVKAKKRPNATVNAVEKEDEIEVDGEKEDKMEVDGDAAGSDDSSESDVELKAAAATADSDEESASGSESDSEESSTEEAATSSPLKSTDAASDSDSKSSGDNSDSGLDSGSDSGSDSDSDSSSDKESNTTSPAPKPTPATPATKPKSSPPSSSARPKPPTLSLHPLEALYKPTTATVSSPKSTSPAAASPSGFKFGFGGGDDSSDDDDGGPLTQTPYRDPARYRSAAPTPDTAIGNKRFFSPMPDSEEEEGEGISSIPAPPLFSSSATGSGKEPLLFMHPESRFLQGLHVMERLPVAKLGGGGDKDDGEAEGAKAWSDRFYEHRGEWNREWKRRKKEAAKARRRRERRV